MQGKKYSREFIDLQLDSMGYGFKGIIPSGICKLEIRNNKCKCQISVKNLKESSPDIKYGVYFIVEKENQFKGIKIGGIKVDAFGRGEYKTEMMSQSIMDSGVSISAVKAISITVENKNAYTRNILTPLVGYRGEKFQWKNNYYKHGSEKKEQSKKVEENKKNEDVKIVEKVECNEKRDEYIKFKLSIDENMSSSNNEKDTIEDVVIKEEQDDKIESVHMSQEKNDVIVKEELEVENLRQVNNEIMREINYGENEEEPQEHFNHLEEEQFINEEERMRAINIIDEMFENYPEMIPFEEHNEEEHWIRIEPRDITVLPIDSWRMSNNAFMLNGYYSYKHLILGKTKNYLGEEIYVLGTPFRYNPRDKYPANLHGFDKFKCCNNTKPYPGEYGYWIKEVKI